MRVNQGKSSGHGSRGSTLVDSIQYIDKNDYYYSFKTRLGSQLKYMLKSRV